MKCCIIVWVLTLGVAITAPKTLAITIPTVPIGNPGNPADTRYLSYLDFYHPNGVGAVAYSYRIGQTEVTNAQYTEFLNAVAASDPYGLYDTDMGDDTYPYSNIIRSGSPGSFTYLVKPPALSGAYRYDDKPVVLVDWGDALRFANWMHNGQPTGPQNVGTTEDGAYTLNGATNHQDALYTVTRNAGARWWLPNEDEWYKAAYHKNDGVTGNYWDYPTRTDSLPNNNLPSSDTGNSANFYTDDFPTGSYDYPLTDAGAYLLSASPYGTFDQAGNVWEWNETRFFGLGPGIRGGAWKPGDVGGDNLRASCWGSDSDLPGGPGGWVSFRVASAVPEPSELALAVLSLLAGAFNRRRTSDES